MTFGCDHIKILKGLISEGRFLHSERVASAAKKIAGYCLPERIDEISVAAMLHDVAKCCNESEAIFAMRQNDAVTEDDLLSPPVYHSFIAPEYIKKYFPELATKDILSSAFNHTTGSPDMSLFDEIIFIADYVEEGRTHASCIEVRDQLYSALDASRDIEEAVFCLHKTVIRISDLTIKHLVEAGMHINLRTVATRNAFLGRVPVPLKEI